MPVCPLLSFRSWSHVRLSPSTIIVCIRRPQRAVKTFSQYQRQ